MEVNREEGILRVESFSIITLEIRASTRKKERRRTRSEVRKGIDDFCFLGREEDTKCSETARTYPSFAL